MVDYSKWKNIEISDDEDDTHPNIDTPSLFRWRHQARVERMEQMQKEQEELKKEKDATEKKIKQMKEKLVTGPTGGDLNMDQMRDEIGALEKKNAELRAKEEEQRKKEKMAPWNVDTISQPGFAKTVINQKAAQPKEENLSDEERERRMKAFIRENEKDLKHFGMLRRYEDSRAFLKAHSHLVGEHTANYLVIWCINLAMEEKRELMAHVAHQTICMQYILELAKQLDYDPRGCVDAFFAKIQVAEPVYRQSFEDELRQFKARITKRAAEKVEEAVREAEEEEKKARLGPGGLDPVEVFETLPEALQKCFESQDVQQLQDAIKEMEEGEATYHMKRCVDSGLWVPDANKKGEEEEEAAAGEEASGTSVESSN